MKLLDKLSDKLTNSLLDYIRRKNGRGRICRSLGVDEDFMIALRLEDLSKHKCKVSYIPRYGPIVALDYLNYLAIYLGIHDLMYGTELKSREKCSHCVFYENEKCRVPTLSVASLCNYHNEERKCTEDLVFMKLTLFIQLSQSCHIRTNQSLFITSYIRYNTACLSVKR